MVELAVVISIDPSKWKVGILHSIVEEDMYEGVRAPACAAYALWLGPIGMQVSVYR